MTSEQMSLKNAGGGTAATEQELRGSRRGALEKKERVSSLSPVQGL
jgi:hypothetical protein